MVLKVRSGLDKELRDASTCHRLLMLELQTTWVFQSNSTPKDMPA